MVSNSTSTLRLTRGSAVAGPDTSALRIIAAMMNELSCEIKIYFTFIVLIFGARISLKFGTVIFLASPTGPGRWLPSTDFSFT